MNPQSSQDQKVASQPIARHPKRLISLVLVLMPLGFLFLVLFFPLGLLLLATCVVIIAKIIRSYQASESSALLVFAKAHGLNFESQPNKDQLLDSSIFKRFDFVTVSNAVYDTKGGAFFCAHLAVGKYGQDFIIRKLQIPKPTPEFILTPTLGVADSSAFLTRSYEKMSLEGEIPKYFQLFTEPGTELEALVALTPDVLQWFITNTPTVTLIHKKQCIYLILPGPMSLTAPPNNYQSYQYQYQATEQIAQYLLSKQTTA